MQCIPFCYLNIIDGFTTGLGSPFGFSVSVLRFSPLRYNRLGLGRQSIWYPGALNATPFSKFGSLASNRHDFRSQRPPNSSIRLLDANGCNRFHNASIRSNPRTSDPRFPVNRSTFLVSRFVPTSLRSSVSDEAATTTERRCPAYIGKPRNRSEPALAQNWSEKRSISVSPEWDWFYEIP